MSQNTKIVSKMGEKAWENLMEKLCLSFNGHHQHYNEIFINGFLEEFW